MIADYAKEKTDERQPRCNLRLQEQGYSWLSFDEYFAAISGTGELKTRAAERSGCLFNTSSPPSEPSSVHCSR